MRKTALYLALFGIFASGAGLALADEMPPDMKMVPAPKPQPKADTRSNSHAGMQGMHHGGRDHQNRAMHEHRMGMRDMPQSGMGC